MGPLFATLKRLRLLLAAARVRRANAALSHSGDARSRTPSRPLAALARNGLFVAIALLVLMGGVAALWLQLTTPAPQRVLAAIPPVATVAATTSPPAPSGIGAASLPADAAALPPAPDPELVEKTPDGPLPIAGRDGKMAWQVYARPFDRRDPRPRICIVISGLGLSKAITDEAIRKLPPEVTLSFMPYPAIAEWLQEARGFGHETLIDLPMEPLDYPREDPGPRALLTSLDAGQNIDRLDWMMSRGSGYIGMITYMGSRFAAVPDQLRPILLDLKRRGLAFVDARAGDPAGAMTLAAEVGVPHAVADRLLDTSLSRAGIDRQLAELEDLARRGGSAIGVGAPYPVTIEHVAAWAAHLSDRGIALAPLSAVLVR